MSHRGKSLIIVTAVLLLKATSHKMRFVALKRSIRAGLNFIDPLTCDRTNTGRGRDKIPGASALKRSNLLSHNKLPFRMTLSIPIRSRLGGNRKIVLTRRVTVWRTTRTSLQKRRGKLVRRRRRIKRRGRRNSRGRLRNRRTRRTRGTRRSRGWRRGRRGRIRTRSRRRDNRDRWRCIRKQKKGDIIPRVGTRGGARIEGTRLIKHDVTRDAHPTTNRVPTAIALMLITVAEKNTLNSLSG
jgi:hypothetical protein